MTGSIRRLINSELKIDTIDSVSASTATILLTQKLETKQKQLDSDPEIVGPLYSFHAAQCVLQRNELN
jgi:hypothetical protein